MYMYMMYKYSFQLCSVFIFAASRMPILSRPVIYRLRITVFHGSCWPFGGNYNKWWINTRFEICYNNILSYIFGTMQTKCQPFFACAHFRQKQAKQKMQRNICMKRISLMWPFFTGFRSPELICNLCVMRKANVDTHLHTPNEYIFVDITTQINTQSK